MNSEADIRDDFIAAARGRGHNWQVYPLKSIDMSEVIGNLLDYDFVVDINGYMYDVKFGYNKSEKFIGQSWSGAPSPNLTSSDFLKKAFRIGQWFRVIKEDAKK